MTPTTPRPLPAAPVDEPPSLRERAGRAALALGVLAAVAALAVTAVSVSGATPDPGADAHGHGGHVAADVPMADDLPPPADAFDTVGVLDLFGNPLRGLDGQPLRVPLDERSPARVPANAHESLPPDAGDPTEGTAEVDLLTAHLGTLDQVADDLRYTLVQRFDLFRINGLVTDAPGRPGGLDEFRALLVSVEQQAASDQPQLACPATASAIGQADGAPVDLIAGTAAVHVRDELDAIRADVGCT